MIGKFSRWEWTALSVPFLLFHLLVYGMLIGFVPGFWSVFLPLLVGAGVLTVYGLAVPLRVALSARARGDAPASTWLIAQGTTLFCWSSGFVMWWILDLQVPDGP